MSDPHQIARRVSILARLVPSVSYALGMLGAALSAAQLMRVMEAIRSAEATGISTVATGIAEADLPTIVALPGDLFGICRHRRERHSRVHIDDYCFPVSVVLSDWRRLRPYSNSSGVGSSIALGGRHDRKKYFPCGSEHSTLLDPHLGYLSRFSFDPAGGLARAFAVHHAGKTNVCAHPRISVDGNGDDRNGSRVSGSRVLASAS
jgi:hypothetical protein